MSEEVEIGVGVGRRRRSREDAERLVLAFERSGLTRHAFSAQHGVSVASLDQYRKRCREREMLRTTPTRVSAAGQRNYQSPSEIGSMAVANRVLPVEFIARGATAAASAEPAGALRVVLANGRRIEVAEGFDAATLERLLAVVETA